MELNQASSVRFADGFVEARKLLLSQELSTGISITTAPKKLLHTVVAGTSQSHEIQFKCFNGHYSTVEATSTVILTISNTFAIC